jgi:FKBP-type peptidyl-prolyl cis-trans isomerase SlyD
MSQMVKECMKVTIEFKVRTTSRNGETTELPAETCSFVYGVDTQYPSVESALMNKRPGDRVQVYVPPEEIYGTYDESLVRELPRSDYKQDRLKEGKLYREMKQKCLVQFIVKNIQDEVIVADFNDPKAGAHAEFDILVKDVRESTKDDLPPSCARG